MTIHVHPGRPVPYGASHILGLPSAPCVAMAAHRIEAAATVSGRLIKDSACPLARPLSFAASLTNSRVTPPGHVTFDRGGVAWMARIIGNGPEERRGNTPGGTDAREK